MISTEMYLKETGWMDVECLCLAYDRDHYQDVVNTIVNLHVQCGAVNFCTVEESFGS